VTSILLSPGAQLRLVFDEITVEPGPAAHRLGLRYKATPVGLPPGSMAVISGALRLQHALGWIGELQADQPLPISAAAVYPRSVLLVTKISDAQLAGIEADRGGGDLDLITDLRVALAGAPSMNSRPATRRIRSAFQVRFRLPTPSGWAPLSPCRCWCPCRSAIRTACEHRLVAGSNQPCGLWLTDEPRMR
jgi:hypothetical protein